MSSPTGSHHCSPQSWQVHSRRTKCVTRTSRTRPAATIPASRWTTTTATTASAMSAMKMSHVRFPPRRKWSDPHRGQTRAPPTSSPELSSDSSLIDDYRVAEDRVVVLQPGCSGVKDSTPSDQDLLGNITRSDQADDGDHRKRAHDRRLGWDVEGEIERRVDRPSYRTGQMHRNGDREGAR